MRDRRGGTLLFGGSTNAFTDASSPVAVGDIATVCTSPSPEFCAGTGATVDYQSLTVMGDTPVSVRDGERGSITLNSVPYDVRVRANVTHRQASTPCSDYVASPAMLDVRAKDLAALATGLPIGALPACHQGNNTSKFLYLSPANTSYSPYEGKAIYTGRDPNDPSTYRFDIPARSPDANLPPPL